MSDTDRTQKVADFGMEFAALWAKAGTTGRGEIHAIWKAIAGETPMPEAARRAMQENGLYFPPMARKKG